MDHLPVFLNIKGKPVLVVGGGKLAARKADLLLRAGCRLTVIAPDPNEDLDRLMQKYPVRHKTDELCEDDVRGCVLAFGASPDGAINQRLHDLAAAAGIPVNISDNTELSDFIMPALVDRSPLLIAIGSSGAAPLLTRMLKARFETDIPAAYGRLAEFAGSYRGRVKDAIPDITRRRRFWETMIAGPVAEHLFSGQEVEAAALMDHLLEEAATDASGERRRFASIPRP